MCVCVLTLVFFVDNVYLLCVLIFLMDSEYYIVYSKAVLAVIVHVQLL